MPWLEVDGLHFGYLPGQPLFRAWSARVGPGVTLVQGDESTGKTTLLRLLAGELRPTAGQIRLDGVTAEAAPQDQAQRVFWIEPRTTAHDATPVQEFLAAQARRFPNWDDARRGELVEGLGLTEHLHKPVYMLSTGSRRKVWLAAAFASGATLTLLDDPFAALDRPSIRFVAEQLQQSAAGSARIWMLADYAPPPGVDLAGTIHLPQA